MTKKKNFPLRIDPKLYDALESWANDEFRSVNSHIEFLLREAMKKAGRLPKKQENSEGE
ncbi:Arc family DNA-binding protein [Ornithinibacillus sp. 179-J 7C1 HS]|uniref:Arc family DNA-binding protein n=1 Tax=Ornithinibacillus sp. 179-J 7C1 HS TaxID=3142384 RepID=UPI00399FDA09